MAYLHIPQKAESSQESGPLLSVKALSKSFGRMAAITNLTFRIDEGEIVGLIGPKRSGRCALLDLLAGVVKPTFGVIAIAGEDVTQLGPDARTRRGVVRACQPADLHPDLTAHENVVLLGGAISQPFFSRRGGRTYRDEAMATLEITGLARMSHIRASDLSFDEQRRLTLAIALAAKARLLLLDHPAVGMTVAELKSLASLIADIRETGVSVLIAEQDTLPLTYLCDRIVVLSTWKIVTDDVPMRIAPHAADFDAHRAARNSRVGPLVH